MKSRNTRNNFDRFGLWQFESESNSFRNFRTELRVYPHLDVSVGDGLSNHFTVTRLGVARPMLHKGGWHVARFKVGNTKSAEAVEALFLDSEFFENRIQRATKEVRLKKWCPRASPKEKALFPVANEIPEHCRNGSVFFRDPNRAMRPVFDKLHELEIERSAEPTQLSSAASVAELTDRVSRRAEQIRNEWNPKDSGEGATTENMSRSPSA